MSLTQAIDDLLAYVENHWKSPDYGDRVPEFNTLDTAVYLAARGMGLHDTDLPRKDATFSDAEVVFFGRTNVPGVWDKRPDRPVTLMLMATQGWMADMLALRALAESMSSPGTQGNDQSGEGETDRWREQPSGSSPLMQGPLGITLDRGEWQARRGQAVADFAGKELPWLVFQHLCRSHPHSVPAKQLLNVAWGQGQGSNETLFAHLTAIREIIKPLGLTVQNNRKVGYKLTELPALDHMRTDGSS
jgi:hypothetical protein